MVDEKSTNAPISESDLLDFVKRVGLETIQDLRTEEAKILTFKIHPVPARWEEYDNFYGLKAEDWKCVKFYDESGNVSDEVKRIPSDKGGIYIYVVKPVILPIAECAYIMYIGRAHNNGKSINLRKRVFHYINESNDMYKGRIQIRKLFNIYKKYLYVMYIQMDNNDDIDKLEKELVSAIVPPINDDLMQPSLKKAAKMW